MSALLSPSKFIPTPQMMAKAARYARRFLPDHGHAEDAAQLGALAVSRSGLEVTIGLLFRNTQWAAWKIKRRLRRAQEVEEGYEPRQAEYDLDAALRRIEDSTLTDSEKRVLSLRIQGFTFAELSEGAGMSAKSLSKICHRAAQSVGE